MILGILSDSHGRVDRVREALAVFDRVGAETLIHCGDVGGISVFDELVGRNLHFVWGNTDVPGHGELAYLKTVGLATPGCVPLRIELAGRTFEVYHGHEPGFNRATANPQADFILHGHTHVPRDERIGGARIINPGALHRAKVPTVATLDLDADRLVFHEINRT